MWRRACLVIFCVSLWSASRPVSTTLVGVLTRRARRHLCSWGSKFTCDFGGNSLTDGASDHHQQTDFTQFRCSNTCLHWIENMYEFCIKMTGTVSPLSYMLMNCALTLSHVFKHREIHMLTCSVILGSFCVCFMRFLGFVLSFTFFPVFCFPSSFLYLHTCSASPSLGLPSSARLTPPASHPLVSLVCI